VDIALKESVGNAIYGVEDEEEAGQNHSPCCFQDCAEKV